MQNLKSQFLLRDDITFLNYGSFGACPKPIFEKYQQLQLELEREPVHFIADTGLKLIEQSREALGNYIGCNKNDVVFVTNPSYAVNTVAKSFKLKAGDEILTTNIEYGACDKTWEFVCEKTGATYIKHPVSFPIESKEQFVEGFFKGVTSNTKLIFLSHITSSTGLRLPADEIVARAKTMGIPTFVDGAHAPGQIPLNLEEMDVDYYTGACHKWMLTPKGSSFLYVRKELQESVEPLVVSWGYRARLPSESVFIDQHQMNGTRDYTAFLTIPAAIDFMQQYNWPEVARQCRDLVKANAPEFCSILGATPLAPLTDDFILQLYSAEIKTTEPEKLHNHLFEKYKIQIPVMPHGDKVYLRYSINAFNRQEDLDRLFDAIKEIKEQSNLIQG